MFLIRSEGKDYVCKGSYIVQGEKYQIIGGIKEAIKFKTKQSALNYINRIWRNRANLYGDIEIVEIKENKDV